MILVTGATGFLGHNLIPLLIERGHSVRVLVRPSSSIDFLRPLGVHIAYGDICDRASVAAAVEGCQAIIHGAGKFRFWGKAEEFFQINVQGTQNVAEAACQAGVQRLVHISTIAVIGKPIPSTIITEETPPNPQDAYQHSKLEGELLIRQYHQSCGLPTIVLRPGAFYGPWGRYAFNRLFFEDPLKGLPIQVHKGKHVIFATFVPDMCRVIETTLTQGRPGEIYNISSQSITHGQINEIVSRLAGLPRFRLNAPGWGMLALANAWTFLSRFTKREPYYPINLAPYVFSDWIVSSDKARQELGFSSTPFEQGAQQTLAWYWEQGIFRRKQ
jgi:dihydroflavonol-4-reductase